MTDIGRTLSWGAFGSFLSSTDIDSALAKDLDPISSKWGSRATTNNILADLYDLLAAIFGDKGKSVRYPRPWVKDKDEKTYGTSMDERSLREWFDKKRKEYNAREVN